MPDLARAMKGHVADSASEEPMAEDKKKSKIDLKARLGKSSMSGAAGPQVPLPAPGQPGAVPPSDPGSPAGTAPAPAPSGAGRPSPSAGIAPPLGLSPNIAPPFAQAKQAPPPPKPSAAQQTIKVEVGEEIHAERKKAKRMMWLAAAGATVLGIGIGFPIGGAKERSDRGLQAVKVAQDLEKEVKTANDKIRELSGKLDAAAAKLGSKTFPTELVTELGGLNVPFDAATNVASKNVGNLPAKLLRPLLFYTSACEDLNKTKDSLKNLLGYAQPQIEKYWKEEKEPVVAFSVVFGPEGSKGMAAELVKNKEPFKLGEPWKDSYEILKTERTQQGVKEVPKKANRWQKGDLTGSDPVVIPVQPASVAGFTSEAVVAQLSKNLRELRETIEGRKDDPDAPPGLLKQGDDLVTELHKAALAR